MQLAVSLTLNSELGLGLVVEGFTGVEATVSARHTLKDQALLGSNHQELHVAHRLQHHTILHPPDLLRRPAELHLHPHLVLLLHGQVLQLLLNGHRNL